jgi:hypothetical protein
MDEKKQEEWLRLCALAAKEQDPEKLYQLVQKINQLLEERENNLKLKRQPS